MPIAYINSLNFRVHLIFAQSEQMVEGNYYFFAHFTARKLDCAKLEKE